MNLKNHLTLVVAIFIMALGIAFSVKANLGTSPISCVPYVLSLGLPLTIGEFTIIFNAFLLFLQFAILRRDFEYIQLLQIIVCVIFGYFIDFQLFAISSLNPTDYIQQWIYVLLGCIILGLGICIEVKCDSIILPGDGLLNTICKVSGRDFGRIKPLFDLSMVISAVIISFLLFGTLVGVREGTVFAALVLGFIIQFYDKIFGEKLNKFLNRWTIKNNI